MTTPSNYQNTGTDLDYSYIEATDSSITSLVGAISNRKTVIFGQQVLSSGSPYPIGNINNSINYTPNLLTPWVDQDSTNIIGVAPTAVFYNSKRTTTGTTIRGQFNLLENYSQATNWQYISNTQTSSPIQIIVPNNNPWTQISSNSFAAGVMGIQQGNTLWGWGLNSYGQLGTGNQINYSWPVQVGFAGTWIQVSSSTFSTLAISTNNALWGWGLNSWGQLGTQNQSNYSSPVQSGGQYSWSAVAVGSNFSVALQSNGTLWAWGNNSFGSLGLNDLVHRSSPTQVGTGSTWTQISCGYAHTLAIQSNGTLWSWGYNASGQLGLSDTTNRSSPVQVGTTSNWGQIYSGYVASAAIQSNGTLWMWGVNAYGSLGLSDTTNRSSPVQVGTLSTWTRVTSGSSQTLAIKSDGTLWSWGNNSFGQLGINTSVFTNVLSPVQVGTLSNWSQIISNPYSSLAIKSDGTLWSWGSNSYGALGFTPSGISVNKVTYGL